MNTKLHWKILCFLMLGLGTGISWGQVTTFEYTGGMQTYVVPAGVTSLHMELFGASGYGDLGYGGRVEAVLDVTPGETLNIFVGGAGSTSAGGYNGGGDAGGTSTYGAGGGASDVRQGGTALSDRIIVAGGGGGSGSNCGTWTAEGGHGGGLIGQSGCLYSCSDCQYTGAGGTQVGGGIAGPTGHGSCGGNSNGTFGNGGSNTGSYGTGGGGGYYGGGSGCFEGAGGGSSYTHPDAIDVVHEQGVRDGNGQVIITVLCTPIAVEATDTEVCEGAEVTLNADAESGAAISWDGGVTDGVAFEPPVGTTTYTVTSESEDDCPISVDITVNALPDVTADVTESEICAGDEVTFTGGGATTYVWDMGVEDDVAIALEETGTYTVTGTDDNGCENTAAVDVVVNDLPEVVAMVDESEVCDGEAFVFTGGGAVTYDWDMGVEDGEPFTAAVGTEVYTVTGTDDNGCVNTATVEATVHALPTVEASASETDVCFGEEVTFTGAGATTYDWDMGVTDGTPMAMMTEGTNTFTVTGTDDNGCENTASVDVEVAPEIIVDVTTEDEMMGGDGSIDITVSGGVAPYTFDWDNDEADDFDDDEDLTDLEAGSYTVVVMDDNGCTTTVEVDVNSQLSIESNASSVVNVYPNPTTDQITIEMNGAFDYTITSMNGQIYTTSYAVDIANVSLEELPAGIYLVTLKSENTTETLRIVKQ